MEVTQVQFLTMMFRYMELKAKLPPELQKVLPLFKNFLSPANLNNFNLSYHDTEILSITGTKRWKLLESPHALTLLRAYALQHLPANES